MDNTTYDTAIRAVERMVSDSKVQTFTRPHNLDVCSVTWEDTGRFKGSSVGPNISDLTLQVADTNGTPHNMPIIRYDNFSDLSCDISPEKFLLKVGNEQGQSLHTISLKELLMYPKEYLHNPQSWIGINDTLYNPSRDSHVLVSAQACFLPVPKEGIATFNPTLFNYQSKVGAPAVLTILCTREGTSISVCENRDQTGYGQKLYHNENGSRASFTAVRLSEFKVQQQQLKQNNQQNQQQKQQVEEDEKGLNMVLLIQVPLKYPEPVFQYSDDLDYECFNECCDEKEDDGCNVEDAVVGHGELEGEFTEINNLSIERDDRFPVRVTIQFYKATSNGVVDQKSINEISAQIRQVYDNADYVGSLVTEGNTHRPTEYFGAPKFQPFDWWDNFWKRHRDGLLNTYTRRAAWNHLTDNCGNNFSENDALREFGLTQ
jgi:hypothetical protein